MTYDRFFPYKILAHSNKLKQIADGEIPFPVIMHIYPTNNCNNDCWFCIMKDEKKNQAMLTKKALESIISSCSNVGVKLIHFSGGGEPLLNKNTIISMALAQAMGLKTAISTNGSIFDYKLPTVSNHIRVSLNAGTHKTYKKDMGASGHSFYDVLDNIKEYINMKNKHNLLCDIGLGFVLSHTNVEDVYEFCKVGSKLGVDFVHIRPAFTTKYDKEVQSIISRAYELSEEAKKDFKNLDIYTIKDKFDGYWTNRTYDKCRSTPLVGVLTATGEFSVCQDVFIKFGNIYKMSLEDTWGSDAHKEAMSKIRLKTCPRCVETKINEVIQHCYINDDVRMDLI